MSTPGIELFFCDMAGTAFRDDGLVDAAFRATLREYGLAEGERFDAAVAGLAANRGRSKLEFFRDALPGVDAHEAHRTFADEYERRVAAVGVQAVPGVAGMLERLRAAGVKVVLATGFAPRTRDVLLEALGWCSVADLVLSPGEGGRGRPCPDMILVAVLRLGVSSVRNVAVAGDTASDLHAGWRAGAGIVAGVTSGAHDRATLRAAPHTHLVETVPDLEPELA